MRRLKKKQWPLYELAKSRLPGALLLDDHVSVSGTATGDTQPALMIAEAGGRGTGNSRSLISALRRPQLEGNLPPYSCLVSAGSGTSSGRELLRGWL